MSISIQITNSSSIYDLRRRWESQFSEAKKYNLATFINGQHYCSSKKWKVPNTASFVHDKSTKDENAVLTVTSLTHNMLSLQNCNRILCFEKWIILRKFFSFTSIIQVICRIYARYYIIGMRVHHHYALYFPLSKTVKHEVQKPWRQPFGSLNGTIFRSSKWKSATLCVKNCGWRPVVLPNGDAPIAHTLRVDHLADRATLSVYPLLSVYRR